MDLCPEPDTTLQPCPGDHTLPGPSGCREIDPESLSGRSLEEQMVRSQLLHLSCPLLHALIRFRVEDPGRPGWTWQEVHYSEPQRSATMSSLHLEDLEAQSLPSWGTGMATHCRLLFFEGQL